MQPFMQRLEAHASTVTAALDRLLPEVDGPRGRVVEAMRYSALSGGKRLRPFLTIETAVLLGHEATAAIEAAAAIEMVHCYSLIHDDLPAMDDSALRRGRPTVHKAFDEATAILAGDGLLTEAFAVLARPSCHDDPQVRGELVAGLAAAAGAAGMVGGQMIDISPSRGDLDLTGITELQQLKTGALITFSCEAGESRPARMPPSAKPPSSASLESRVRVTGQRNWFAKPKVSLHFSAKKRTFCV